MLLVGGRLGAQEDPRPLVVIDAGHGGVDPGAHGPSGVLEKHVTLAVARKLAAHLLAGGRVEVRLTRDRDTLIALRDRPRLANAWRRPGQPALFVSLHCNASPSPQASGVEVYVLSEAKTEDARRVAAFENAAERYETNGDGTVDPVEFIRLDLLQNHYLHASTRWAVRLQRALATAHRGADRGVKQAGFRVLVGAFMPAVLIELGFLTHPDEERWLADPDVQDVLAARLARAIERTMADVVADAHGP